MPKNPRKKKPKTSPPDPEFENKVGSILDHPDIKGKQLSLQSMSFTDDDPTTGGKTCLKYENQKVVTVDPVTGQKTITIQPVCVQWG